MIQESGANLMQRLSVQMLCYQLDNTWQYFTRTFKMQVTRSLGQKVARSLGH
jgi:hypothetical protein